MEETSTGVNVSFSHLNKLVAGLSGEGLGLLSLGQFQVPWTKKQHRATKDQKRTHVVHQ